MSRSPRPEAAPSLLLACALASTLAMACGDTLGGKTDAGDGGETSTMPTMGSGDTLPSATTFGEDDPDTGCTDDCGHLDEGEPCISLFQDCAAGLKCSPYWLAQDLGGPPTDFKCVPVQGELGPGADCTLADLAAGLDDCDEDSFCWTWGGEEIAGRCYPFCTGGFQYVDCIEGWDCVLPEEDDPPMCVLDCLPLAGDCPAGSECLWSAYSYSCVAEGEARGPGEVCELFNDCTADMDCVDASAITDCAGEGCCAQICSLAEGDGPCQALDPAYVCVPALDDPPNSAEDIGHCRLP